jgi:hypothetical protein
VAWFGSLVFFGVSALCGAVLAVVGFGVVVEWFLALLAFFGFAVF